MIGSLLSALFLLITAVQNFPEFVRRLRDPAEVGYRRRAILWLIALEVAVVAVVYDQRVLMNWATALLVFAWLLRVSVQPTHELSGALWVLRLFFLVFLMFCGLLATGMGIAMQLGWTPE